MGKQLQKVDRDSMNGLFQAEVGRIAAKEGITPKTAKADLADDNGKEQGEQAFKDHEEYVDVVESVIADDKSDHFNPNDPILD